MKKTFVIAGALLCGLLIQSLSSLALVKSTKAPLPFFNLNTPWLSDYSGSYNNSSSNQIQVWFEDPGDSYPEYVIFLTAGVTSGSYSVVAGTYNVVYFSSSNVQITLLGSGQASQINTTGTFPGVTFSGSNSISFDVYNYN